MDRIRKYALLFKMLCDEYDGAEQLGKKAAQKIFYFYERKGIPLNLRYGIHYYGPYSEKLDNAMYELESEGFLSIDTSGKTHIICLGQTKAPESALSKEEKKIASNVLSAFEHKSPMELEALATMDYVANVIVSGTPSKQEIVDKFKEIKGTKFTKKAINETYEELKALELIVI